MESFNAFEEIFDKDRSGNIIKNCNVKEIESSNNIIIGDNTVISLLGINDLVIVKNRDNILISKKNKLQDIKKIVGYKNENSFKI